MRIHHILKHFVMHGFCSECLPGSKCVKNKLYQTPAPRPSYTIESMVSIWRGRDLTTVTSRYIKLRSDGPVFLGVSPVPETFNSIPVNLNRKVNQQWLYG